MVDDGHKCNASKDEGKSISVNCLWAINFMGLKSTFNASAISKNYIKILNKTYPLGRIILFNTKVLTSCREDVVWNSWTIVMSLHGTLILIFALSLDLWKYKYDRYHGYGIVSCRCTFMGSLAFQVEICVDNIVKYYIFFC